MTERFVISSFALLFLGVCLWMSLRLLYGARGPAPEDGVYLMLRIVSWALIIIPLLILAVAGANWLSLILIAAIIEALFELVLARRAAQRQAVWRLLAGAIGSGRSLVDALQYHQRRFSGIVGRWQRRLVNDLERGVEWREAVWENRAAVPREAPTFAAMVGGNASPGALAADVDEMRYPVYEQLQQETLQRFMYLGSVFLMMLAIVSFVMLKIIPSFQMIFEDFGLELPIITIAVINASNALAMSLGVPILILTVIGALAAMVIGVLYLCDIPVLQGLTDRLTLSRHRAQVMQLLAAGFEQSQPVDHMLTQLTVGRAPYPSAPIRRRLQRAYGRVAAGNEWQESLASSGIISAADAAVLRAAQAAGNAPWALRMLAQRKMRRATFRLALIQQIGFVLVVLTLGFLVFLFAVAMMAPLADIVYSLAD